MLGASLSFIVWIMASINIPDPLYMGTCLRSALSSSSSFFVIMPVHDPFIGKEAGGFVLEYDHEIEEMTAEWFSLEGDEDYEDVESDELNLDDNVECIDVDSENT
jgi:hypothetical protein